MRGDVEEVDEVESGPTTTEVLPALRLHLREDEGLAGPHQGRVECMQF